MKILISIASLLCLTIAATAYADKPVITSVSGVSGADFSGLPKVFGGFGGASCVGPDLNSTCDSCAGGSLAACNATRAYNALNFRVSATHTDAGNLILVRPGDFTAVSAAPHNPDNVSVPWSSLCGTLVGGVSDCETTPVKDGSIFVCVDKNLSNSYDSGEECQEVVVKIVQIATGVFDKATSIDGITDFVPYPADSKTYIEDLLASPNFPYLSHGGKITAVRVFMSDTTMTEAAPGTSLAPKDLPLVNGSVLADNVVEGLRNGTPYWIRLGLLDEANNLAYFWPPAAHVDQNGKNCDTEACEYTVTPEAVAGKPSPLIP